MADKPLDLSQLAQDLEQAGSPWQMAENPITQLTEAERRQRLGFTPPPGEMSIAEAALAFEQGAVAEIPLAATVGAPASVDLRNLSGRDYTTPVKNQGGCGSCVAFGTSAVMETTYKRKVGGPNAAIDLSEAHLFFCHGHSEGRNCGNGWWPEAALKKARDIGVTTEDHYPYTATDQACTGLDAAWHDDYARVKGLQKLTSPAAMKQWIATHGSITGCFVVYQDFFAYSSGVYTHQSGSAAGGHCVEIIGYDDALSAWICKNSWGTGWGDHGYFKIGYGQCQIETYSGPWGATGVELYTWRNTQISGLWSNDADRNAHAYLAGTGWRRLTNDSETASESMMTQLVSAKMTGRTVRVRDEAREITQIYS